MKTDTSTIASATLRNGLYQLYLADELKEPVSAMVASLKLWHERLAHLYQSGIKRMIENGVVNGANINSNEKPSISFNDCILSKIHRAPIPKKSDSRARYVLDIVHFDVV